MQLGRQPNDSDAAGAAPSDLASALRDATARRGHRPALTVVGAGVDGDRRDEQAFATVAQWAAKGAHLLQVDLGLGPGDRIRVDSPAGWPAAAVCLAAWWIGVAVTDGDAPAAVVHEDRLATTDAGADWIIGHALDGTAARPTAGSAPDWAIEVQAFPDQPPMPVARPELPALLLDDGTALDQATLLGLARALPAGRLGCRAPLGLRDWAVLVATRPAATGQPTVLVASPNVTDAMLDPEGITAWA